MGGRGSGSGRGGGFSKDGALTLNNPKTVETRYFEARGWSSSRFSDEVLEAATDGKGNLTFTYASGGTLDRKRTRLNSQSRFDLVCRLLLEKKK